MQKYSKKTFTWIISMALLCCGVLNAKDSVDEKNIKQRLQIGCEFPDTTVIQTVSRKLAEANPELEISISKIKQGEGVTFLEKGILNMLISDTEAGKKFTRKFQVFPFAVSAVKIIVSSENTLTDISSEKTAEIFSRAIINWNEAGGHNAPICIYGLNNSTEAARTFETMIMKTAPIYDKILSVSSDKEIASLIASDKNGIGYSGMTNIKSKRIKTLTLNKTEPSMENIISGKYECARKLYIITVQQTEQTKRFMTALNSPSGNEALKNSGLIPLPPAKQ
ncbi:MAG: hypothetical protein A2017_20595 [Lentisphaerae bacterium GWF2_44_16]|nr:MAG: hypothetical protein A2017_20595 [Lentisphaerae bacterium GWF2_44_16]